MIKNSLFIFLVIILISCQKEYKTEKDLLQFVSEESNGYLQNKNINGIEYTLQYKPTDLLVLQELKTKSKRQLDRLREKYKQYLYFNLSMSIDGVEITNKLAQSRNRYGAMMNQLSFDMEKKVKLYTSKNDTVEMVDFVYPRMYGISKSTTIMFVYPRTEKIFEKDNLYFVIKDLGLSTGDVTFTINTDNIKNEPLLSFD